MNRARGLKISGRIKMCGKKHADMINALKHRGIEKVCPSSFHDAVYGRWQGKKADLIISNTLAILEHWEKG